MARIRYLKPEFFTDDQLCALPPHDRLAFAGLWCHADREGRLEDRPARLRALIFPYEPKLNMVAILDRLAQIQAVVRYTVDGHNYLYIHGFAKHQRPHSREVESDLPAPPGQCQSTTKVVPEHHPGDDEPCLARARNGEGKGNGEGNGVHTRGTGPADAGTARAPSEPMNEGDLWDRWRTHADAAGAKQPTIAGPSNFEHLRVLTASYTAAELDAALAAWWASPHTGGRNIGLFRSQVGEVLEWLARTPTLPFRAPTRPQAAESMSEHLKRQEAKLAARYGVAQ